MSLGDISKTRYKRQEKKYINKEFRKREKITTHNKEPW